MSETVDKATILEGLNEDLAHEYQAIIMYNTYAAAVSGIHRKELQAFFLEEVADEFEHAKFLADKITALGGTPVTRAAEVTYTTDPREMLENVVKAETETVKRYVKRMKQAEAYGDYGLASTLDDMVADETRHKEESEKILRGQWGE
ncbi:ferritin-like domain-containing protein [Lujinxingia vulgaris]|uniref:Ferritin-like domain-containing protein n=1 Tax=Lujinxingia vulgaris TaxID=2600176 RepID=A0A5C6XB59_9DELT|nr:ferritin-like domain-containing protein [Lujinxingia vulgaris]TXD36026.1 ferritin-like domain-containing protein [Lujinxingia vulgaris]